MVAAGAGFAAELSVAGGAPVAGCVGAGEVDGVDEGFAAVEDGAGALESVGVESCVAAAGFLGAAFSQAKP